MEILVHQNVLLVKHVLGDEATARRLAGAAHAVVTDLLSRYPQVAAIQAGDDFATPDSAFFQIWGDWVKQHNRDVVIVAYTSKAWVRAIAKSVSHFANVRFATVSTYEDAVAHIVRLGFPDTKNVAWHSAFKLYDQAAGQ